MIQNQTEMSSTEETNKRKKTYFKDYSNKRSKLSHLDAGYKGFIVTCNFNEYNCLKEGYNLLNEVADKLYNQQPTSTDVKEDVEAALEQELHQLKTNKPRFQQVMTNCKNVLFIRCTDDVCPLEISKSIFEDIADTKNQKTRYLLRFIPIIDTCKASIESIIKSLETIIIDQDDGPKTYMVHCKIRNNNSVLKLEIISKVAELVKEKKSNWKVNFDTPDITVAIEIINKIACITFLPDLNRLCKYNLIEYAKKMSKKDE